jgi:phage-related protein
VALPRSVQRVFGFALLEAQEGRRHVQCKPLSGFGSAGVLEVVEDYNRGTYRAVYTVEFDGIVYVLDAFQKKSKKGSATPKMDIDRIKERLAEAERRYARDFLSKKAG